MKYSPHVWNQLKNKTSVGLISALNKELRKPDEMKGNEIAYRIIMDQLNKNKQ